MSFSRFQMMTVLLLLGAAVVLGFWNPRGDFWIGVEEPKAQCESYDASALAAASKVDRGLYDPQKLQRLLREPQNTLSNVFYLVAAVLVFQKRRFLPCALAFSLVFLGFGSGLYHASLLPEWRLIDIIGVYQVLMTLGLVGVLSLWSFSLRLSTGVGLGFFTISVATLTAIYRNDLRLDGIKIFDSTYVVVALVTLLLSLSGYQILFKDLREAKQRAWSLSVIFIPGFLAIIGGLGDRFGGFWAKPEGLVQGHALWHSAGALALTTTYFHFRRQRLSSRTRDSQAHHELGWRLL